MLVDEAALLVVVVVLVVEEEGLFVVGSLCGCLAPPLLSGW